MSKYAPGPWEMKKTPSGKGKVVDRAGFSICNTTAGPYSEQCANARLMAAAPDLLKALQGLSADVEGMLGLAQDVLRAEIGNTNVAVLYHWLKQANAAISKAEETHE